MEFQELEIQLADKNIKEYRAQIEQKKEVIATTKERITEREKHLKHKKKNLTIFFLKHRRKKRNFLRRVKILKSK